MAENNKINLTRIFAGLMLMLIGLAWLFESLNLLNINFDFSKLWPLLIILLGLAILSKNSTVSNVIGLLVIVIVLAIVLFAIFNSQPVQNEPEVNKIPVLLFYYKQSDDESLACGPDAILPVMREIEATQTPIQDTINLLIKGELTEEERALGFTTEFPNPDFKLLGANLKDGVLYLEFTEVPGFTTGGSCRISLLTNQIIKTAKQFPGVNEVVLLPESLFQP